MTSVTKPVINFAALQTQIERLPQHDQQAIAQRVATFMDSLTADMAKHQQLTTQLFQDTVKMRVSQDFFPANATPQQVFDAFKVAAGPQAKGIDWKKVAKYTGLVAVGVGAGAAATWGVGKFLDSRKAKHDALGMGNGTNVVPITTARRAS